MLKELNEARHLLASAFDDGLDQACLDQVGFAVALLEAELDAIDARRGYQRRRPKR